MKQIYILNRKSNTKITEVAMPQFFSLTPCNITKNNLYGRP